MVFFVVPDVVSAEIQVQKQLIVAVMKKELVGVQY